MCPLLILATALLSTAAALTWPDLRHPDLAARLPSLESAASLSSASYKHTIDHEHVQLFYEVEHHDNIVELDMLPWLSVPLPLCPESASSLVVPMSSRNTTERLLAFLRQRAGLPSASPLLLCGNCSTGKLLDDGRTVVRAVHAAFVAASASDDGLSLKLALEPVGVERFFRNANVSFSHTVFPTNNNPVFGLGQSAVVAKQRIEEPEKEAAARRVPQQRLGGWFDAVWSACATVWSTAKTVAYIVQSAASLATKAAGMINYI